MDASQVGKTAAIFMQQLDEKDDEFVEEGARNIRLGEIVIIGEIFYEDEDGNTVCSITTASSIKNRIHQSGIVSWGQKLIDDPDWIGSDADDDEED